MLTNEKQLLIVIVGWRSEQLITNCLFSLSKSSFTGFDVIVVLNEAENSEGISVPRSLCVSFIYNAQNQGFARACNQGWRSHCHKYVLFLNPDTLVRADTLSVALTALKAPEGADIIGVKHLTADDKNLPSVGRFPSAVGLIQHSLGLHRLVPALFKPAIICQSESFDYDKTCFVDQVSGAFFLTRRALLRRFKGFDEKYFVYYEELDLCRRVSYEGGSVKYLAETSITHFGGAASSADIGFRMKCEIESRIAYCRRHMSWFSCYTVTMFSFTIEPILRLLAALAANDLSQIKHVMRAYFSLGSNQ